MTRKAWLVGQDRSRLLRCLRLASLLLQSRNCGNVDEFARQLEVSRRTIFRDLKVLRRAGVAIEYDENRRSYYIRAPEVSRKSLPLIESKELLALALCVHTCPFRTFSEVGRLARRGISQLLEAQFGPVGKIFPDSVAGFAQATPQLTSERELVLLQIFAAIMQELPLQFSYNERTEKLIPYHLRRIDNSWLVCGRSLIQKRYGTFDLAMMENIQFGAARKASIAFSSRSSVADSR